MNFSMLKTKQPKVLVVGDLMIDEYLWGNSDRVSAEAPVPVVLINSETSTLGGAGNVVKNLVSLGAVVDILSVISDDGVSKEMVKLLVDLKVSTQNLIVEPNRVQSKKTRVIAAKQQVLRYDKEIIKDISLRSQKKLLDKFSKIMGKYDIVLLSDYMKGVLTESICRNIIEASNKANIKVLVDPKGEDYTKYCGAYLLTPNKQEAIKATQININNQESLLLALNALKGQCKLEISLITLGKGGIATFDDNLKIYKTKAKEVYDVTGAGDTVLASLGFAFAKGLDLASAIEFANLAAGVVVGKIGSATVTLEELNTKIDRSYSYELENVSRSWDEISSIVDILKSDGKTIAFTNGCFDILHPGHVRYLEEANRLADILIIGLNSDTSVSKLKGQKRPINKEFDRATVLLGLGSVDYLVIFDEDTPRKLIQHIKPDILIKGGDYKDKVIEGSDLVDKVKFVNFFDGYSTSSIVEIIKTR